jgi:hypothetical protein
MVEVRKATMDAAAMSRLDAIRATMGGAGASPSLQKGAAPEAIEGGGAAPGVTETKGQEASSPGA